MKTISVTINDLTYKKFAEIQRRKEFNNQSDTLEFVINQIFEQFKKEAPA